MPTVLQGPNSKHLRAVVNAQEFFDFLVPRKEWFGPEEVAAVIGMKTTFVYELMESGKLDGFAHNAGQDVKHRRKIHRTGLVSYLMTTATFEPADYVSRLLDLITRNSSLTAATLIAEHAVAHRNKLLNR